MSVAKLIANHYKSYESWHSAITQLFYDEEELMSIIGVGEEIIYSLKSFFSDENNVEMVSDLASQLTILPVSATNTSNSIFSNKTVVFTGKLSKERKKLQAEAESVGEPKCIG